MNQQETGQESSNNETDLHNPGNSNTTALSLFIIILAFFIFTIAISKPEGSKKTSLLASVEKTFGGLSMAERKAKAVSSERTERKNAIDFSPVISGDSELSKYAEVRVEYNYSAIAVPADFVFDGKSVEISRQAEPVLEKIVDIAVKGGYAMEIIGYPSVKGYENARLAAFRSSAVAEFLNRKGNVSAKKLTSFSWTGPRYPETAKSDIQGVYPEYIEIVFHSGKDIEEDESFKFKDFIFRVYD
jgi:flagellar motor protein MotB